MRKFEPKYIDEMQLEDFLELEFNKVLYKDFNEGLKPYFEESSLSFFKYIYRDAAYFYSKYNKIQYDVDKYFDDKYSKEGRELSNLIKREIIFDLIEMVTTPFFYNKTSKEYIPTIQDDFINGENFPFFHKHYFRIEGPIEEHWHIEDFVNAKCNYRHEVEFHEEINQINTMKEFLGSIDVSEKEKRNDVKQTPRIDNYFPKLTRLAKESSDLGVDKAKQLYGAKDFRSLINEIFENEYRAYIENKEYFPGCPLNIYKKTYQKRFTDYQLTYPDADEFDFLRDEDALIQSILDMDDDNKRNFYFFYKHLFSDPHKRNLKLSSRKTRDNFIDNKIYDLGHYILVPGYSIFDNMTDPGLYQQPRSVKDPVRNPEGEKDAMRFKKSQSEPLVEFPKPSNIKTDSKESSPLKWSNGTNYEELNKIYHSLNENDYLNCGLKKFKDLFHKEDADPIKWEGTNTSLIYFFDLLISKEKIKVSKKVKWKTLQSKFNYDYGNETQILSPIKNGYKDFRNKDFFDNLIK